MDASFWFRVLAEFASFVVIAFVLYRYVWPFLKPMMERRQDAVQEQVEASEDAARRLREAEERFESALAEARGEAARIRDDARADSTRIKQELRDQADREAERIRQRGDEQLVAHREQTIRQLRAEIGGLSMQLAERMVVDSLSDEGRRSATVDGFLDELDGITAQVGEQRARAAVQAGGGDANPAAAVRGGAS